MYEYVITLTPDDDPNTGVSMIPDKDYGWIVDYASARAKQTLGLIRRKFGGGVNMPDGSTEQLDGQALMDEGKAEQKELEDDLKHRARRILPIIG